MAAEPVSRKRRRSHHDSEENDVKRTKVDSTEDTYENRVVKHKKHRDSSHVLENRRHTIEPAMLQKMVVLEEDQIVADSSHKKKKKKHKRSLDGDCGIDISSLETEVVDQHNDGSLTQSNRSTEKTNETILSQQNDDDGFQCLHIRKKKHRSKHTSEGSAPEVQNVMFSPGEAQSEAVLNECVVNNSSSVVSKHKKKKKRHHKEDDLSEDSAVELPDARSKCADHLSASTKQESKVLDFQADSSGRRESLSRVVIDDTGGEEDIQCGSKNRGKKHKNIVGLSKSVDCEGRSEIVQHQPTFALTSAIKKNVNQPHMPTNELRYKVDTDLVECQPDSVKDRLWWEDIANNQDLETWLVRAPVDFSATALDGAKGKLCDSVLVPRPGKSNEGYQVSIQGVNQPQLIVLLPSKSTGKFHVASEITGYVTVTRTAAVPADVHPPACTAHAPEGTGQGEKQKHKHKKEKRAKEFDCDVRTKHKSRHSIA